MITSQRTKKEKGGVFSQDCKCNVSTSSPDTALDACRPTSMATPQLIETHMPS